jgi:TonB family protein
MRTAARKRPSVLAVDDAVRVAGYLLASIGATSQNSRVAKQRSASRDRALCIVWAVLTLGACGARPEWPADTRARRELTWDEFRRAVEHYQPGVKRGQVVALGPAADSYAAYLQAFHRPLHLEFAHEFLGRLGRHASQFGDLRLRTKLEIVIEPDGSLNRVGIIRSSGDILYDFQAFNAVQRGAPYPPPPVEVRSPDGRTYLRWTLHRNESQCGAWNAEPYILSDVP